MSDVAIRVKNLGKQYRIGVAQTRYNRLSEAAVAALKAPFQRLRSLGQASSGAKAFWALQDVSFEIKRGEAVAVIGRNGAGKSTLLKILSHITDPTEGRAELWGRVGSLLEVGTGFHPELTGRENVYLNGTILGMKRIEIDRKFDEIVAFAGVEKFLDTPVKHYSSGMYVRLAFAVAAHLEPEILLIDEVLAVGDASFQQKCLGKMGQVARGGRTVVFVSHNMVAVQALCNRAILLSEGKLAFSGSVEETIARYLHSDTPQSDVSFDNGCMRTGSGKARFTRIRLLNECGEPASSIPMGSGFVLEMDFYCTERVIGPNFGIRLFNSMDMPIVGWGTRASFGATPEAQKGGTVRLHVERLELLPGRYHFAIGISDSSGQLDRIENAIGLEITPKLIYSTAFVPSSDSAILYTPCSWALDYN